MWTPANLGERWFKGWLQTWLVHMRDPLQLARDLGPGSFLVVQILFAGMVVSALAHPFIVVTAIALTADLALARPIGPWKSALFVIDFVNLVCGYLSFLLLGWQTLARRERKGFWKVVVLTPAYWLLMSAAAWRAVWQLWRDPFLWEKTPHVPERIAPTEVEMPQPFPARATGISALRR